MNILYNLLSPCIGLLTLKYPFVIKNAEKAVKKAKSEFRAVTGFVIQNPGEIQKVFSQHSLYEAKSSPVHYPPIGIYTPYRGFLYLKPGEAGFVSFLPKCLKI